MTQRVLDDEVSVEHTVKQHLERRRNLDPIFRYRRWLGARIHHAAPREDLNRAIDLNVPVNDDPLAFA